MIEAGSRSVLAALIGGRLIDTALGSLGVSAAVASASFAIYMAVIGPSDGGYGGGPPPVALGAKPTHMPLLDGGVPSLPSPRVEDLDFTPTGSVTEGGKTLAGKARLPDAIPKAVLTDFAVRDVFDGTALVEAHGTLHMVTPGSSLEGAGQVLAIEQRGRAWVVRTAAGTIVQRR